MTKKSKEHLPSEEEVREYLQQNPNFLEDNKDILETINISHKSGKAISLVERQVEVMRDRNKEMNQRVEQMVTSAEDNAVLFEKTNRLVLSLLKAKDLEGLVKALYSSLGEDFATQTFSLTLIDNGKLPPKTGANLVTQEDANKEISALLSTTCAVSGVIRDEETVFLFGPCDPPVASVVTLPLTSGEKILGVLALGNENPKHYSRDTGTLFVSYIGELLNELLPKYLNS